MRIARTWSGSVPTDQADRFHDHLLATGVAEAETTDGFIDAMILNRDIGDRVQFSLITCWADRTAAARFAGTNDDTARRYPGDERFDLRPDRDVIHHRVVRARTLTWARRAYTQAAGAAALLLAHPAVASSWDQPSALEHYAVSGLAGHLAGQIFFAENALAQPEPATEPISLMDYYDRVDWIRSGPDSDPHLRIRSGSEMLAVNGAAALAARAHAAVARLPEILAATPVLRRVQLPSWQWALTFDDFLHSRLIELAVHIDDLAVSVDLPAPPLPPQVTDPVLDLLTKLATRTHGVAPLLRALTRSERAPASIAAF
jgi:hypothetical protein